MILGIEARHAWTPAGASEPAVVLNKIREGGKVWPRYVLHRVTGLGSLGEPEDLRRARVGAIGEIAEPSLRRGRTVTYEGDVLARSLLELREAEQALRDAFASLEEGRMDVTPHPENGELSALVPVYFEARPLTCEIADVQESKDWRRPFVIALRQGDPRHFESDQDSHSAEITTTAVGEEFDGIIAVPDNARGPILALALPQNEKETLVKFALAPKPVGEERFVVLRIPKSWEGGRLTLDWYQRTITDENGNDRTAYLDSEGGSLWLTRPPASVGESRAALVVILAGEESAEEPYKATATLSWEKGYS